MAGERRALIIATGEYEDPKLARLRSPAADAERLAEVLRDPDIGDFEVEVAKDEDRRSLGRRLADFFRERRPDDLVLVHVSCHGILDDRGRLFLAARDTEIDYPDTTAISSGWLNDLMTRTRARRSLLLLDCSFSGRFPFGMRRRSGEDVHIGDHFGAREAAVISASAATEYAYEGDQLDELSGEAKGSVFTTALVEGLETGEADRDQDRWISVDDVYDYVYDRVKAENPAQTPTRQGALEGDFYVARSVYEAPVEPGMADAGSASYAVAVGEHITHYWEERDFERALDRLRTEGTIEAATARISPKSLARILQAAPQDPNGHPMLRDADFSGATFEGDAHFGEAQFSGFAWFPHVQFSGDASFGAAEFSSDANFRGAQFSGYARFANVHFSGGANFDDAQFSGDAEFGGARFSRHAEFGGVRFSRHAGFGRVSVEGGASFESARFDGPADFSAVAFRGSAYFANSDFTGPVEFRDVLFSGQVDFERSRFGNEGASFRGALFEAGARLTGAEFEGEASSLLAAEFRGPIEMDGARFKRDPGLGPELVRRRSGLGVTELKPSERLLSFLALLEPEDRVDEIVDYVWPALHSDMSSKDALDELHRAERQLREAESFPVRTETPARYELDENLQARGRLAAGPEFAEQVRRTAADYWVRRGWEARERTEWEVVAENALRAIPYLAALGSVERIWELGEELLKARDLGSAAGTTMRLAELVARETGVGRGPVALLAHAATAAKQEDADERLRAIEGIALESGDVAGAERAAREAGALAAEAGRWEQMLEASNRGLAIASERGSDWGRATAYAQGAVALHRLERDDDSLDYAQKLLVTLGGASGSPPEDVDPIRLELTGLQLARDSSFVTRRLKQALEFAERVLELTTKSHDSREVVSARLACARILIALGDYEAGEALLQESMAAQALGDQFSVAAIEEAWAELSSRREMHVVAVEHQMEALRARYAEDPPIFEAIAEAHLALTRYGMLGGLKRLAAHALAAAVLRTVVESPELPRTIAAAAESAPDPSWLTNLETLAGVLDPTIEKSFIERVMSAGGTDLSPSQLTDSVRTMVFGTQSYEPMLGSAADGVSVGEDFEMIASLEPAGSEPTGPVITRAESASSEVSVLIDAPGCAIGDVDGMSLPFEPQVGAAGRSRGFRLTALRPGVLTIKADVYVGLELRTTLNAKVEANAIEEPSVLARPRVRGPLPDAILEVRTLWSADLSEARLRFRLTRPRLNDRETTYLGDPLESGWPERTSAMLRRTLGEVAGASGADAHRRFISFGAALAQDFLPSALREELAGQDLDGGILLLIADEDAGLPWELFRPGRGFLGERMTVGRWLRELDSLRPTQVPLGAPEIIHFEDVLDTARWRELLVTGGAPDASVLPGGVLADLADAETMQAVHIVRRATAPGSRDAPVRAGAREDGGLRHSRLALRRNRPLATLSFLRDDRPDVTTIERAWAAPLLRAGCSAFVGPLWPVDRPTEECFLAELYRALWDGAPLGTAFRQARVTARFANPGSFDSLAYVLFGDPLARPYVPAPGGGYATIEPVGRMLDAPVPPGASARYRARFSRLPPVWNDSRVLNVDEESEAGELDLHVLALDVEPRPDEPLRLRRTPDGAYMGWFTVTVPPDHPGGPAVVQATFTRDETPIHSVTFALPVEHKETTG